MDNQNSTERSVGFFSLSVILHVFVVAAILGGAAYKATMGGGSKGDSETVTMEMVEGDGEETQPAQVTQEKPEVKVQPVVETKPVQKTKPAVKAAPKAQPSKVAVETETQDTEEAPEVNVAAVAAQEAVTEETVAHEEETVAAVPPRPAKEATQEPVAQAATSEAPQQEAAQEKASAGSDDQATVTQGNGEGEGSVKGDGSGATPDDAKAFADLKQKPGNRSPKYPMNARRAKQEGNVELMYFVTKEGQVDQIKIVKSSGYAALDNEAMQTIRSYKFYPGQEGWTNHPVTFSLQGDAQQVGGLRHLRKEP